MATVTGLTAERMLEIEAASIVSGEIQPDGHLQLTTHGGDEIDAGYALVAIPDATTSSRGSVELATQAEVEAHTDTVRAVTPGSLASTLGRITDLETEPGERVQVITAPAESAPPSSYSPGVTVHSISTGSGWSVNSGFGTILTVVANNTNRAFQMAFSTTGTGSVAIFSWYRTYHSPEGWSSWVKYTTPLDPSTMGFTGEIKMYAKSTVPFGWLACDGSAVNRVVYADLFALIGTTYGSGNGTTTFNLPNLKGRVPVGLDTGQTEFDTMGETGGAKTHTLTTSEMPVHTHTQNAHQHTLPNHGALTDQSAGAGTTYNSGGTGNTFGLFQPSSVTAVNNDTGGGGAHNNLQPYITVLYIIKT